MTENAVPAHEVVDFVGDHYGFYGQVLPPDTRLVDDLGADPIDIAELLITIEEEFDVELNLASGAPLHTIADLLSLVQKSR